MFTKLQMIKSFIQKQIHDRFSYTICYEGVVYQGLYDTAFMNWFNPNPLSKEEIQQIQKVKSTINARLQNLI
ncbi:hypothetical protein [Sporosarcina sp. NPDC096371]|uniref:hypothetical protein n=1 Tax=Sporosarcina sp. NPDC096371 TaxID=3364530 RepID=UPI00380FBD61